MSTGRREEPWGGAPYQGPSVWGLAPRGADACGPGWVASVRVEVVCPGRGSSLTVSSRAAVFLCERFLREKIVIKQLSGWHSSGK